MAYQVIARKYRPQRFADVVGQEHVTQTLANAIQQKRIAHAYLFVGPRGTGKTTIARIFAMCLNCTGGPKVDFAADDPRCLEISEGRSLDVLEIDGASNRGIEEIRALRETVRYAPATGRFKVYIIDEVHMLTKEAFNALLKTLEEPPEHVKFMFATTEPEKVLPTILSRCQRYDLRRIPVALIVQHLGQISRQEKVAIDEAALHAIARGADGCMRDAESTLDQLISFCGEHIVESDVLSMFGLTSRAQIQDLCGAVLAGDMPAVLSGLEELSKNGKDLGRLVTDMLAHFRNLLLYQVGRGDLRLLEVTEAEVEALKSQAKTIATEGLTRLMEILTDCESRLRDTPSKQTWIEVSLFRAIQSRQAVSLDALLQQLRQLQAPTSGQEGETREPQRGMGEGKQAVGAGSGERRPISKPTTIRAEPVAAPTDAAPNAQMIAPPTESAPQIGGAPAEASLEQLWANVIEAVGRVSQFTRSYLLQAHPVSLVGQTFTIGFDPEFADHIDLVDNPKNRTLIQTKLRELGCGEVQLKFIKDQGTSPTAAPSAAESPTPKPPSAPVVRRPAPALPTAPAKPASVPFSKEEFLKDPLIQQALEIFKGQIVEVRA